MQLRRLIDQAAFALCIACVIVTPAQVQAADDRKALLDFFGGQGCAIGPATHDAAIDAGYASSDIDAFARDMLAEGLATQQSDWLVLSSQSCTIRIPDFTSVLRLTDPDVAAHITDQDAYAEEGEPGCFLEGAGLLKTIQLTHNWDPDTANLEYLRLLGMSIGSGDLAFYSENPLRTPYGPALTTGTCAEIPVMPEIKRNHDLLVEHFDGLVRANAEHVVCDDRANLVTPQLPEIAAELSDGQITNAWLGYEIQLIAWGAGWYEGVSMTERGTPRPPICHYD